jgi:hypothetical protein
LHTALTEPSWWNIENEIWTFLSSCSAISIKLFFLFNLVLVCEMI